MKIVNNSEQFTLKYDGRDYTIPKGEFEVVNRNLVNHLLARAKFWQKDVKVISEDQPEVIKQGVISIAEKEVYNPPIAEDKVEQAAPAFSGASMNTLPKKMGRPRKNVEQIA